MKICFDLEKGFYIPEEHRTVCLTPQEQAFIDSFFNLLQDSIDTEKLNITKNSDSYTTITYTSHEVHDIVRFKLTDKTMWVSVFMTKENATNNITNPIFEAQKNKKQLYWKSNLKLPDDCSFLKPCVIDAIKSFN